MTFLKKHDREVTFQVRQQIAALTPGFREDMGPHVESDNVYVIQVWMHVGRKSAGGVGAGLMADPEMPVGEGTVWGLVVMGSSVLLRSSVAMTTENAVGGGWGCWWGSGRLLSGWLYLLWGLMQRQQRLCRRLWCER